ncbi:VOC family protein [Pseudonocardia xishanensis]|uniref:VOC domain-containing protein n=1 Tax=Pseudonocardia xishanensis TaxID=630995 RepID=A0ABP8RIR5_9PSEU
MEIDLFACVAVSDLTRAINWFDRLLGEVDAFAPNDVEHVWTLAEHRHLYVELLPEHAGHSRVTVFVDDLDEFLTAAAERGVRPVAREQYGNGVTKVSYRDPDGNDIGVGGQSS